MAFRLYKGPNGSTGAPGAERFIASGAVTEGIPVKLVAGASGASLAKVATVAAGSSSSDLVYGIPIHSAADGEEVLVIPALPGIVWEVDAAADADVSNAAADNYLATSTYLLTVGASTNLGKKCHIIGISGKASDRKYLVHINQSAVSGV
jgi:hypothetical protein